MAANLMYNDHGRDYISDLTSEIEITKDSPITDYFRGKTVFVTGVTGFLGHLYLEKLLRIGAKSVYVFMRPKKDRSPEDRLQKILAGPVFDRLRRQNPQSLNRIKVIAGTLDRVGLGLSTEDVQDIINNVDIIIHSAADVRFDISLLDVISVNLRGTRELLRLAKQIKHLQMFLYVSTAYSNCNQDIVKEEFYQPPFDPNVMIKWAEMAESDDDKLANDVITSKIISPWPNTYTFTKALSEDLVRQFGKVCPVVVIRPSIIIATYCDPIPGWLNNISGINGVVFGIGLGFIRSMMGKSEYVMDAVCADMVTNTSFAAMCYTHSKNNELLKDGNKAIEPQVFNIISGKDNPINLDFLLNRLLECAYELPIKDAIWYPFCRLNREYWQEYVFTILYHAIPGLFFDIYLNFSKNKIRLLPLYRKMRQFIYLVAFFMCNKWNFHNKNTLELYDRMTPYDKQEYPSDMRQLLWSDFLYTYALGVRKYIFKQEHEVEGNRLKYFKIAHYLLVTMLLLSFLYIIYMCLPYFTSKCSDLYQWSSVYYDNL